MKLSDLWNWRGDIGRWPYLAWGVLLMGVKCGMDFVVAGVVGQSWSPLNYFSPQINLGDDPSPNAHFLMWMATFGLPFAWAGVVLTLRRLRAVGLPSWLVFLFFASVLNVLFFILLVVAPERTGLFNADQTRVRKSTRRFLPKRPLASAVLAVVITAAIGISMAELGAEILGAYSLSLFVLSPFTLGLIAALVHGARQPRSFRECFMVTLISVLIIGVVLLFTAFEGVLCLIMALPLVLPLALLGCCIGYLIQRKEDAAPGLPSTISTMALTLPILMLFEHASQPKASLLEVHSFVEIAAPPEIVWHNVIQFSELPPPTERIFHTGIAYPIRAKIYGQGPGAIRYCIFSTGAFVEPIEVWDEPHLLRFGVTVNPPPMEEWSPYAHIHPPHLDGYLVSDHGQFLLTLLPNGHTRLEGTTWYRNHMWPEAYWQIWSNYIIHKIHLRVLNFIRDQSEKEMSTIPTSSPNSTPSQS